MTHIFNRNVITTGLAIFSMFFGAGNLMFPLMVGLQSGNLNAFGITGFILTGVLLPFAGLIAIILFQGDYAEFFYRLGKIPGALLICFWTSVAGPLIAMPRITTLSYTMIQPFVPFMPLFIFTLIFLTLTFLATYKESRIVDLLGDIISPLLLISLIIIIVKGIWAAPNAAFNTQSAFSVFWQSLVTGYQTLDILGGILFSSVVISILQKKFATPGKADFKRLAWLSFQSGSLGVSLLALIYIGLSYLGSRYGNGLGTINEGELFSAISFKILGPHGAAIIALAVILACYSTIIALSAVYAEFLQKQVFKDKIGYTYCLIISLGATLLVSNVGLSGILYYSRPIINITYPSLITLTLCNIAYKTSNFTSVKLPVGLTLLISLGLYFWT